MKFIRYQHIEKYGSPLVEGILEGEISIFPKLDGKCTSVYNDNGIRAIGGRRCEENKQSSPHVYKHFDSNNSYNKFVAENPDLVLFGEFGNKTTIGYYNTEVYNDFFVFDVVRFNDNDVPTYLTYDEYVKILEKYGIKYIQRIATFNNISDEKLTSELNNLFVLATEHFVDKKKANGKLAEGIVIKNYNYKNKYGKQIWAKCITDEYFMKKVKHKEDGTIDNRICEEILVDETLTESFISKELFKFKENNGALTRNHIPKLFDYIWTTWVQEEILNIFKVMGKHKKSVLDYKILNSLMKRKIISSLPDLFEKM